MAPRISTARKFTAPAEPPVAIMPEAIAIQEDGGILMTFLTGLAPFFSQAGRLEGAAFQTLLNARALQAPSTPEEDVQIQTFCKNTSVALKQVEEHWNPITSRIHKLHKALTGARARATAYLEEAGRIGNRIHQDFREAQERAARIEGDRLRREAEDRARQDRQRELDEIERQAVEAEQQGEDLSERERVFAQAVYRGATAVDAARQAGFRDPAAQAQRLMKTAKVTYAIEAMKRADEMRQQAEAVREQPLAIRTEEVKANVTKAVGVNDRTTWGGECFDEQALIAAVLDPITRVRLGIPTDILSINPVKINEYGRALREKLDAWPGVRHKKTVKVV